MKTLRSASRGKTTGPPPHATVVAALPECELCRHPRFARGAKKPARYRVATVLDTDDMVLLCGPHFDRYGLGIGGNLGVYLALPGEDFEQTPPGHHLGYHTPKPGDRPHLRVIEGGAA